MENFTELNDRAYNAWLSMQNEVQGFSRKMKTTSKQIKQQKIKSQSTMVNQTGQTQ